MTFRFLTTTALLAVLAMPTWAQVTKEDVLSMLSQQGYREIHIRKSLFGNLIIEAEGPQGERSIVIGKKGEILSDRFEARDTVSGKTSIAKGLSSVDTGDDDSDAGPDTATEDDDTEDEGKEDEDGKDQGEKDEDREDEKDEDEDKEDQDEEDEKDDDSSDDDDDSESSDD